jgi:hypothetical protein
MWNEKATEERTKKRREERMNRQTREDENVGIMRKGTLSEDILQSQQGAPREKRCGFDNNSHRGR